MSRKPPGPAGVRYPSAPNTSPGARFWSSFNLATACIGIGTGLVMTFLIPLIVVWINSNTPSGNLYLALVILDGVVVASAAVIWTCRSDLSARSYVLGKPILRAGAAISLAAVVVSGVQIGVLGATMNDNSGEVVGALIAALIGIGALWLVQLPTWRQR